MYAEQKDARYCERRYTEYYYRDLKTQQWQKQFQNFSVERLLQSGNVSALFSPVSDYNYLSSDEVFVGDPPLNSIQRGDFKKVRMAFLRLFPSQDIAQSVFQVPMITGVLTSEGVLMGYFIKGVLNRLSVNEIK